ncbi:MAG: CPBP family intramembrane metalloprotease [Opitutaceae bacterium]|nr:CPBP family intramembrane metalloprotease [Opitutaceae bacterium]
MSALLYIVAAFELAMIVTGLVLLWRVHSSPTARLYCISSPLDPWSAPVSHFLLFVGYVFLGTMIVAVVAQLIGRGLPLTGDALKIFNGAAGQFGMIAGVAAYHFGVERVRSCTNPATSGVLRSGVITFLISLPVLAAASYAWKVFLRLSGLPDEAQDLIRMFAQAESAWLVVGMTLLAVVVAPIAEELVFRAGLYRYFRTRMPRSIALVAPALFFAVLHVDWPTMDGIASVGPLVALAIVYSIAYERTGSIATTIVAHALFNLNTIVMILSGVGV